MPNRVRLSVVDHKADDFMAALEAGLFSMDGSTMDALGPEGTALYSTSAAGTELRIRYTTIDGEIHATSFVVRDAEGVSLRGRFEDPEPLGFGSWGEAPGTPKDALYDALLGDSQFDVRGNRADNGVLGSEFDDVFRMGAGDDSAYGGAGDDVLKGGRGDDLLIGGPGNDTVHGGRGNDLMILGDAQTEGATTARGGAGNDVFVQLGGLADIHGGRGNDWIIIESFNSSAGGSPNVQTRVRDFDPGDFLMLADWGVPIGGITGETLADLENGTIDEFQWRDTARGVQIEAGDARILLRGVSAEEVDLDQILFAEQSAEETAQLFDSAEGGGLLGRPPGGDPYYVITMEHITGITNGFDSMATWGGDLLGFFAFGTETGI